MQMLTAVTSMVNGGRMVTPHVVKEYQDSMGNVLEAVPFEDRGAAPVEPGYLDILKAGMRQSVTSGVARNAAIQNVAVAGKTGTAEFGEIQWNGKYPTHGWFAGFAPYDDPQIAVVVFLERGSGGNDAAPAAGRIFDFYFNGSRAPAPKIDPIPTPGPVPGAEISDEPPPATDAPAPAVTPDPVPASVPTAVPIPVTPAPTPEPPPDTPPPETPPPSPQTMRLRRMEQVL
jgi:membrane peptidoglycan carboxypeptidase